MPATIATRSRAKKADLLEPVMRPLRSERDYQLAVKRIDSLLMLDPTEGSPEDDLLDLLSVLVEAYEEEHEPWTQEKRSPQSLVKFMARQKGVTASELAELMGGRSRLSDFFKKKRELSRTQLKALRDFLGIPADLLI